MAIKELQTRIALKYDSYSAWTSAPGKDLVLLAGELGICHISDANQNSNVVPTVLFKVGDGTKTFEQLPWASAKAADVYSWAKASEVKRDGKKLVFVGGAAGGGNLEVAFDYVTLDEVKAITNGLDSRITALEDKFKGENDVQGQLDALDGRLDVLEGADTVEGSVANALKVAKKYTDDREVEIKKYADQAEADAISAAETASEAKVAVERARIAANESAIATINGEGTGSIKKAAADVLASAQSYADTAEADAVSTAKGYTDTREAAIKTAYEAYADRAEADAKSYVDGKVSTLNAKDSELAGNISSEATARENADKAINDKIGGSFTSTNTVAKAISDAQANAEANAATTAQSKVDALANGQVKTNKEAIATNASEIARVEGLVTAEAKAREDADKAIDERLDKVEAFFEGAAEDSEGLNDALDKLVDIQNYLSGEGSATNGLLGQVATNAEAIEALSGRMDTAEDDIEALEAMDAQLAQADTALGGRIDALVGTEGTIAKGDAATLASAKSYADDKASAAETAAKGYADGVAATAKSGAEAAAKSYTDTEVGKLTAKDTEIAGNVTTLQNIVDGYSTKGSIKTAIEAAAAKGQQGITDAAAAKSAADAAQGTANTVKSAVENATTGLAATKSIADKAASDLAALTTRVTTAEGDIDDLEAIVNDASKGNEKLRTDVNALQTLTGDSAKGNTALYTEITRVAGLVDNGTTGLAATKSIADAAKKAAEDNAADITTIKNDYLKAADVYIFNCGSSTTVTHEQSQA